MIRAIFIFFLFVLYSCQFPLEAFDADGFFFNSRQRSIRIPVQISHNLVIVSMHIDDSPPLNFILDSGVGTTIITEPLIASVLGIDVHSRALIRGLGEHGIIEAGLATGLTFSLPGLTAHNMNLIVLPENVLSFGEHFGFPVHGIIGNDLFKDHAVRINYQQKNITIYRHSTYRIPRRAAIIPLEIKNNKPYIHVSATSFDGNPRDSLDLLVDLGASYPAYLNDQFRDLSLHTIPSYLGKGISGELTGRMGRIRELNINGFKIKNPTIAFPEKDFSYILDMQHGWDGIIGGGILKRFHIIMDYPTQRLVIWRNSSFGKPFTTNLSGIEIIAFGSQYEQFVINYVRKNSVAHEQDIRVQDQLLMVNNKNVSQLGLDGILDILSDKPGQRISLQIKRGDQNLTKNIILREDLP
jgi:hypothetical protein